MNQTQLTTRSWWLAGQLRSEAQRWSGKQRSELIHASLQLAYQARTRAQAPEVAAALIEAATSLLVTAMSARAFLMESSHG